MREAQLRVGYPDSAVVDEQGAFPGGPQPRVPEVAGLRQDTVRGPLRLAELLRHPDTTVLLWSTSQPAAPEVVAAATVPGARCYLIAPHPDPAAGTVLADPDAAFAAAFGTTHLDQAAYIVRPDGYIGYRTTRVEPAAVTEALAVTGLVTRSSGRSSPTPTSPVGQPIE